MYKFIKLTTGKIVQAFYEADEDQVTKTISSNFDFKELTDGKTAQKIAFVDADGNKITLFPGLGPELHTTPNAASDPNGNEANATTGFTQVGLDVGANVFASQGTIKNTGNYAIEANSNDTPTPGARFYLDLDSAPFNLTLGNRYLITFNSRHVGVGDRWIIGLGSSDSNMNSDTIADLTSVDTTFIQYIKEFTHSVNSKFFGAKEFATNSGGIYFDNFSVKEIL